MQRLWERVSQTGLVKMPVRHTPEGKSKSRFNLKQLKENQALTQECVIQFYFRTVLRDMKN